MHQANFQLKHSRITVFGGSGFIGRYIVRDLARAGAMVRVICRDPQGALDLKTAGYPGQISLEYGNILNPRDAEKALTEADAVINLVGILYEGGKQRFDALQHQAAANIAKLATEYGIKRLVHFSALGVDAAHASSYARSKFAGEKAVLAAFPAATILRPSVVFGADDSFFNRFASMAATLPFMPLIGGGKTRLQPVYVGDVAAATIACLTQNDSDGQTYELAGPSVHTLKDILQWIAQTTQQTPCFINLPFSVASALGSLLSTLPIPPMITADQVRLLRYNNIANNHKPGLNQLGISAHSFESVMPEHLTRYHQQGFFARFRAA